MDNELTRELKEILKTNGADLTGIGDISGIPAEIGRASCRERVFITV